MDEIAEAIRLAAEVVAKEEDSLVARFILETGLPPSRIELCYGMVGDVHRIFVRERPSSRRAE